MDKYSKDFDKFLTKHCIEHRQEKVYKRKVFERNVKPYLTVDGKFVYRKSSSFSSLRFLIVFLILLIIAICFIFWLSPDFMFTVFTFWRNVFNKLI